MPGVRDFLERFRPAGAPGPAAAAVPADRRAELTAELEPVFAALTSAERTRGDILAAGEQTARKIREEAQAEAARLVERAREGARAERDRAAAEAVESGQAERAALAKEAAETVEEIRHRAAARLPDLAERAVGLLGLPARSPE